MNHSFNPARIRWTRTHVHLLVVLSLGVFSPPAGALMFTFSQVGYSSCAIPAPPCPAASITGSFAGTDLNGNGALSSFDSEITAYSMTFSGNSLVPAFTHVLSDLFLGPATGLVYVLGTAFLGDDASLGFEGIGSGPPISGPFPPGVQTFTYLTGIGPTGLTDPNTGLPVPFGVVQDNNVPGLTALDHAFNFVVVTPVPEPPMLALLGIGLVTIASIFPGVRRQSVSVEHRR